MNKVYTYTFPPAIRSKRPYAKQVPIFLLLGATLYFCFHRTPFDFSFKKEPNRLTSGAYTQATEAIKKELKTLSPTEQKDIDLIARTVYGEARGEKSPQALEAIAHVILNRVKDQKNWPFSIREVVLQKQQFSCWNETDPNFYIIQSVSFNDRHFQACYKAALNAFKIKNDLTGGANHYHAKNVHPTWARKKHMIRVAQINKHIFYKG